MAITYNYNTAAGFKLGMYRQIAKYTTLLPIIITSICPMWGQSFPVFFQHQHHSLLHRVMV